MVRPAQPHRGLASRVLAAAVASLMAGLLAGCGTSHSASHPTSHPHAHRSITMIAPRSEPPSGRVEASIGQTSSDTLHGNMEVWLDNGTDRPVRPRRIVYLDPRLAHPVLGQHLRRLPVHTSQGYPLPLPPPACGRHGTPRLMLTTPTGTTVLSVADEADVVARYVAAQCLAEATADVVRLRWADTVPVGPDGTAHIVLVVTPTGRGGAVHLDAITGTPNFGGPTRGAWFPRLTLRGTGPVRRIALPVAPPRCDGHGFSDSPGITAFRLHMRAGGRSGSFILRMSDLGTGRLGAAAVRACGH